MDLKTYQEVSQQTAKIGLTDPDYFLLGILGELGEIAEKTKKVIRDHDGQFDEETLRLLWLECGDLMWYLTQFATVKGIALEIAPAAMLPAHNIKDAVIDLGKDVAVLIRHQNSPGTIAVYPLMVAISSLATLCEVAMCPFEGVLEMNIEKIFSRKERGVLHGSGDER